MAALLAFRGDPTRSSAACLRTSTASSSSNQNQPMGISNAKYRKGSVFREKKGGMSSYHTTRVTGKGDIGRTEEEGRRGGGSVCCGTRYISTPASVHAASSVPSADDGRTAFYETCLYPGQVNLSRLYSAGALRFSPPPSPSFSKLSLWQPSCPGRPAHLECRTAKARPRCSSECAPRDVPAALRASLACMPRSNTFGKPSPACENAKRQTVLPFSPCIPS